MIILNLFLTERGAAGNSHEEGGRENRKRSGAGRAVAAGSRQPGGSGEATIAMAEVEDNQSLIEIKDSVA